MSMEPLASRYRPEQITTLIETLCLGAEKRPSELTQYNCFGALLYVVGLESQLTCPLSMREMGVRETLNEAMTRLKLPFIFQLCGGYSVPDGMGGWECLDGVVHVGLVLEKELDGNVKIFDKFGRTGPVRTRGWNEMIADFFKEPPLPNEYARFLSVEDFIAQNQKRW